MIIAYFHFKISWHAAILLLLYETIIEQLYYVMKSKMVVPGKFKSENWR